ncbi:LysR family transcriptional regulator [Paenibacillus qinlingensis]|uniref:DNA-binding transcriptional LysR family regulator n=1 Tax=Paenibacillus qinlingensis TaxID=1837343 RepID=A0ABU1NQL2_9BACL|nr:LysR family transcriptional regulator [Paenibacillus qinlingensis]MDR6549760.1 DNA-binding transcriptional LysR family regulator [Paenibacillus qinlingensis]
MRIEWLESFQLTAELKSLTKASESLHISQPALSKQIRNLEDDIGAQLLLRSSSGVTLTPSGQILLERSRKIIGEVNTMRREIALSVDGGKADLTIGSWPSVSTIYVPTLIAGKLQAGMNLEIKIRVYYTFFELLTNMENGTLDAIFMDDRGMKHPFHTTPVFMEDFLLFVNVNHPLFGNKENVFFDEIKDETFVMLPEGCDVRFLVEKEFAIRGQKLHIALELELGQGILGFIQANLGIAILPAIFVNQINETMKAIPISDFSMKRRISVITREESVSKLLLGFI